MRVMLDTNILISAAMFPGKSMDQLIQIISAEHQLVLSSYVIDEFKSVAAEKFPNQVSAVDKFFSEIGYEYVYTPEVLPEGKFEIRDSKDYPVLYSAVTESVDVLVTGDKDFADVEVEDVDVCTPFEFIEKYVKE